MARLLALRRPPLWAVPWAAAALALGLALARLPLTLGVVLVAGAALLALAAWEPALGLGLAVVLGPARAFISIAWPGAPADLGQLFFLIAVAGWLARSLVRRAVVIPRLPLLLPLAGYLGVGVLSLLGAEAIDEGLKEALKWAEVALVLVILVEAAEQRGRAPWVVAAVLVAGLAQAAAGIWQYQFQQNGPEHFRIFGAHFRAYGSFEQPNPYAGFLGLIWPVAAGLALGWLAQARRAGRWRLRWLAAAGVYGAAALLLLAGLYVSFSRGAWLGAAAAALALGVALPRRWWAGLALAAASVMLLAALASAGLLPGSVTARLADATDFLPTGQPTDVRGANITTENYAIIERLAHWQAAEAMAADRPWLGVGLGNYSAAYPRYRLINWPNALGHAHMIYLNVLAETGALGLAAYLILWGAIFALTMRVIAASGGWRRGLALGLLGAWTHLSLHQLVDNLYVNNVHLTLAALLALLVYLWRSRPPRPAVRTVTH